MPHLRLLISPLARNAYFDEHIRVAIREISLVTQVEPEHHHVGGFDFLDLDEDVGRAADFTRLSTVQGVFRADGGNMVPLDVDPGFLYHEDLVYAQKYQGKTNETVTQLALNVGLHYAEIHGSAALLDPMAGRGTSLLWALRYGMDARGIEIDPKAVDLFHAHVRKQCKLRRIRHHAETGKLGKDRAGGEFSRFTFGARKVVMIHGDSRRAEAFAQGRRFDVLLADLPYGIQHGAPGDVKELLSEAVSGWTRCLKHRGAVVIIFNNYVTPRADLVRLFETAGLEAQSFACPHRMSESIVRDVVAFTKPRQTSG